MTDQTHFDPMAHATGATTPVAPTAPASTLAAEPVEAPAQMHEEAAVAREAEADPTQFAGELAGHVIRVLPMDQWRKSTMRALRTTDFDAFGATAIHPDDREVFDSLDPTLAEMQAFFTEVMKHVGQPAPGKSAASPRS